MKKFSLTFLLAVFAVSLVSITPQSASAQKMGKFKRADKGVPNQYIVVLNDSYLDKASAEPSVRSNSEYLGYVYGGKVKKTFGRTVPGFGPSGSASVVRVDVDRDFARDVERAFEQRL